MLSRRDFLRALGGLAASLPLVGLASRAVEADALLEPELVEFTLEGTDDALYWEPLPPITTTEYQWYSGWAEHVNCRCVPLDAQWAPAE